MEYEIERIKLARKKSPAFFVAELQKLRDDELPAYPSAQLWYSMTDKERAELQKEVIKLKKDWNEYEKEMMAHFPQKVTQDKKIKNRIRGKW
jgi:hypothetical protein